MKQEKSYKDYLIKAGFGTFLLVILTLLIKNDIKANPKGVIAVISLLGMLAYTIYIWIRTTKKYIDYAIEEKGKDQQIINIAIEEKIKQLQIKE